MWSLSNKKQHYLRPRKTSFINQLLFTAGLWFWLVFAAIQQPQASSIFLYASLILFAVSMISVPFSRKEWFGVYSLLSIGGLSITLHGGMYEFIVLLNMLLVLMLAKVAFINSAPLKKCYFRVLGVFSLVLILVSFVSYQMGISYNELLPSGSRNALTAIVIFCFLGYAYAIRDQRSLVLFYSSLMAIWVWHVGGRSSLLMMLFFILIIYVGINRTLFLVAGGILVFTVIDFDSLQGFLKTPRYKIWDSYLGCMNLGTIFLGPGECLSGGIIEHFSFNLHNSILRSHDIFGLGASVLWFFLFRSCYHAYCLKCRVSFGIMVVFSVKAFFDILVFPGAFDFIILYMVFDLQKRYMRQNQFLVVK